MSDASDMKIVDEAATPLSDAELERIDRHWRAANYLSVGQIYLLANPLLTEPLAVEHIKPRLLGHWGTTPGLNILYSHLNRVIVARDLDVIYVTGPGHGGPGLVANTWLEGSYSEVYPTIGRDAAGMARLFKQFSFPGGIPSHVAPETPGSINEGGELGYSLAHAFGAAFDNPDLIVACVVGDGEAETGALATSWHGTKFLDAVGDGAVLPVLHLNGYKIANPTVLARIGDDELGALLEGCGWAPYLVEGDDPATVHHALAATLDAVLDEIAAIQRRARVDGDRSRPRWPLIVLRTPKGWTGPAVVDGLPVEGTWRAHQVPLDGVRTNDAHRVELEAWMRTYRPEELFDEQGRPQPDIVDWLPEGRGGWVRTRTRTAAGCGSTWSCPTSVTTRSRWRRPPREPPRPSRPGCSAAGCATWCASTPGGATSVCSDPTRPPPTGSTPCSRSPTRSGRARSSTSTSTSVSRDG